MRYGSIEDRARHSVRNAVRSGKIIKPQACEQCGKDASLQAHHADYEQPLAVKWLCASCHGLEHRKHQGPAELQSLRDENTRLRAALKAVLSDIDYLEKHGPNSVDMSPWSYSIRQTLGIGDEQKETR